jgi:hypothetical protein
LQFAKTFTFSNDNENTNPSLEASIKLTTPKKLPYIRGVSNIRVISMENSDSAGRSTDTRYNKSDPHSDRADHKLSSSVGVLASFSAHETVKDFQIKK